MPASPSEPDRYSIDEMMERLKTSSSGENDEGELVTRPDGTQVLRIRKRKRRTNQPVKEGLKRTRRVRMIRASIVILLFMILGLSFGAAIVFGNSPAFLKRVVASIAQVSGASVEMEQFRMNPKTANAEKLMLQWPEGNVLKSLSARGISSEISPSTFLGKSMSGEEVLAAEGILTLRMPDDGKPLVHASPPNANPLLFKRYRVPSLQVNFGEGGAAPIRLFKSEATLDPKALNGRPQLNLYRGDLSIKGWPKMRMDRALMEFRGDETDIINMRVMSEGDDQGILELAGILTPYDPERPSSLAIRVTSFELDALAGPGMGRLVSGRVDSNGPLESNTLVFQPSSKSLSKLEIAFRASPLLAVQLHQFPFLFNLSQILDDAWFEKPSFDGEAKGGFRREGDTVTLQDLLFESKGRMAVRGGFSVVGDQSLSGIMEVGLTEGIISASKDARLDTLFSAPKEGYRWVTLKLSGPVSKPVDNFKELYSDAVPEPADGAAPEKFEGPTFEELTRPR